MKLQNRALLLAAALSTAFATSTAFAAGESYWMLKAVPALKPAGSTTPAAPSIGLKAAVLPEAMVGTPYSFDLKTLAEVRTGPGVSSAQFSLGGGLLPSGVALASDGLLSGNPTAAIPGAGASFEVVGTYMGATGQQTYAIRVAESQLTAVQIVAGTSHACALTAAGAVKCWGANHSGQLGDGSQTSTNSPIQVPGLASGVRAISAGASNTCAVTTGGGVLCWGAMAGSNSPVQVQGLASGVRSISVGSSAACVVSEAGAALCWGSNPQGQLGDGTRTSSTVPVQVVGLTSGVSAIAVGGNHACAIKAGAYPVCWGSNSTGQLGNGGSTATDVPVDVGMSSGVTSIAAGLSSSCAVTAGGAAMCWGGNAQGQLGDGTTTSSSVPVLVSGLASGVASISIGLVRNTGHVCAVANGGAWCWGPGGSGALGQGSTASSTSPVQVVGLAAGVTSLTVGNNFSCGVQGGMAKCWGMAGSGQLGNGSSTDTLLPVSVKAGD